MIDSSLFYTTRESIRSWYMSLSKIQIDLIFSDPRLPERLKTSRNSIKSDDMVLLKYIHTVPIEKDINWKLECESEEAMKEFMKTDYGMFRVWFAQVVIWVFFSFTIYILNH